NPLVLFLSFSRMNCGWRLIAQGLVRTPIVVPRKPPFQGRCLARDIHTSVDVNLLVFHTSPEPLNEHIVHPAASSVHADSHPPAQERLQPRFARKLAALVRIHHARNTALVLI